MIHQPLALPGPRAGILPLSRPSGTTPPRTREPLERCHATAERSPGCLARPPRWSAPRVSWIERVHADGKHVERHHAVGVDADGRLRERVTIRDTASGYDACVDTCRQRRFGTVRPIHWRSEDVRDAAAREHLALPDRSGHLVVLSRASGGGDAWLSVDLTSLTGHAIHRASRVVTTLYPHTGRRVRHLAAIDPRGRTIDFAHCEATDRWSAAPVTGSSPSSRPFRIAPASLRLRTTRDGEDVVLHVVGVDERGQPLEARRVETEHASWQFAPTLVDAPLASSPGRE